MKIGDTVFQNKRYTNQNARLLEIDSSCTNGKIIFENGVVRSNVNLTDFYNGVLDVSISGIMVGDEKLQRNGLIAKVVSINNNKCDIEFENGLIKRAVDISYFKLGSCGISKSSYHRVKEKVGKQKVQMCGMNAKIISYNNGLCDIEFENGLKRYNVSYTSFIQGSVNINKSKVGKKKLQKCGQIAEVICDYKDGTVDLKFENGIVREKVVYASFVSGSLSDGSNECYIGQRVFQGCGMYAEIIELLPKSKCSIRFENGYVKKNISRKAFKRGLVSNKYTGTDLIGSHIVSNGIQGVIEGYSSSNDCIKVLFENGILCDIKRSDYISNNINLGNIEWNISSKGFKYKVYKCNNKYTVVFQDSSYREVSLTDISRVPKKLLPIGVEYIKLNTYNVRGIVGNIINVYYDSFKGRYIILMSGKNWRRLVSL